MKKLPPAKTVLTDAESHEWTRISKKQADQIMSLLDEWIDWCESRYAWIADKSNNAVPKHQRPAAELRQAIAIVKVYRGAIQSDGQAFWALVMLNVARAASVMATLDRDIDWFVNHDVFKATLTRQQTVSKRRQWLADLIDKRVLTKADIDGSRLERNELRKPYETKWRRSSGTFLEDLKSLGYEPR